MPSLREAGLPSRWGQTEFQVNLKLGLTPMTPMKMLCALRKVEKTGVQGTTNARERKALRSARVS